MDSLVIDVQSDEYNGAIETAGKMQMVSDNGSAEGTVVSLALATHLAFDDPGIIVRAVIYLQGLANYVASLTMCFLVMSPISYAHS